MLLSNVHPGRAHYSCALGGRAHYSGFGRVVARCRATCLRAVPLSTLLSRGKLWPTLKLGSVYYRVYSSDTRNVLLVNAELLRVEGRGCWLLCRVSELDVLGMGQGRRAKMTLGTAIVDGCGGAFERCPKGR